MLRLVTTVLLLVTGAQELNPTVKPNLVLWLSADAGLEVTAATSTVVRWRDQSGGGYEFAPLSATQHRQASARFFAAVAKQRQRQHLRDVGPPVDVAHGFSAHKVGSAVTFPAPLVANNVQLRDGLTAFFVLKPAWLEDGDQAVGQRFFGHYPYGQFRFHDRHLSFKADGGDYMHSADDIVEGDWLIAAYRFDGDVSISLDGLPFERIPGTRHEQHRGPTFSTSGYVTLGGCPPFNSFIGEISEVLVFGVPLSDTDSLHVVQVLADKHKITLRTGSPLQPGQTVQALPSRHVSSQSESKRPAIPAMPAVVDSMHPHERAVDRLSSYRRIKEARVAQRASQDKPPNELLDQIKEAQARLNELQSQQATPRLRGAESPPVDTGAGRIDTGAAPAPMAVTKKKDPCFGGDAFEKVSVSKWQPPDMATFEQIQTWKKAVATSESAIKSFPRGGKELRSFVHSQVSDLRLLRHNSFCALLRE